MLFSIVIGINLGIRILVSSKKIETIDDYVQVVQVTTYDDYQKVVVKYHLNKYYFNSKNLEINFSSGDYYYLKGNISLVSKEHVPNGFNYRDYLKYNGINGKINVEDIAFVKHGFHLNLIHEKIVNYINNNFNNPSKAIIAALVIGDKTLMPDDLNDQIKTIGISHLFVISGLHMQIVSSAIFLILKKIKIKQSIKNSIVLGVLLIYYVITSLMVSILRVIIGFIISKLLEKVFVGFTSIDKLSINAVAVLMINPYYLFNYSFLLSYSIVFGILAVSQFTKNGKGIKIFLINNIIISTTSLIVSLPIVVSISPTINLLSIIFNLFFIPFVTYILLPFSFITLLIPPLKIVYQYVASLFILLTSNLSNISWLTISFSKSSILVTATFYILFIVVTRPIKFQRKLPFITLFILLIIGWFNSSYLSLKDEVYFLDLPSGDAVMICEHHNLSNVLIDTGDIGDDSLVNFILSKGIRKIDALFITHSDSDHIGGIKSVMEKIKVDNIYLSAYDDESIEYLSTFKTNLVKLDYGNQVVIRDNIYEVLWPKEKSSDVNNNSLVLYASIFNSHFLLLGDIESPSEDKLSTSLPHLQVDYLKVAHHGSITSSSDKLLKAFNQDGLIAIAMNGYNNTFGFPSKVIRERFSLYEIPFLNTIDYGTIYLSKYYFQNDFKIYSTFGFT